MFGCLTTAYLLVHVLKQRVFTVALGCELSGVSRLLLAGTKEQDRVADVLLNTDGVQDLPSDDTVDVLVADEAFLT